MSEPNSDLWFDEEIKPLESSLRSWLLQQFRLETEVDDVLQESYIRIIKAYESRSIAYPKAYLYRTARNVAFDFLRSSELKLTDALEDTRVVDILVQPETPPEIIQRDYEINLLKEAIAALPNRCRKIFTLRKIYGLSYKEISVRLKISERTISAQMNIAIRKCANFIERKSEM